MPDKKREPEFTVTDRRRFTSEGQPSSEAAQSGAEVETQAPAETAAPPSSRTQQTPAAPDPKAQAEAKQAYNPPSAEEQKAQEEAFHASTSRLDAELKSALGAGGARDLEMTFERFVASLYMTSLLQLGLMRDEGGPPPPVDLVGARQTIDTIAILSEKTKGNLSPQEEALLQNCLYELRMAYIEVTNALARPPQPGARGGSGLK